MREEKKIITAEYIERLNQSPYFIVVDYTGLTVAQFTELRKRLRGVGAEVHVVKNSIFRIAAKEAEVAEIDREDMKGQLAAATGAGDVSAAAKILKNFQAEFEKPKIRFGFLNNDKLSADDVVTLASLPSLDELRAQIIGTIQTPATQLARILNTPGTQVAQVLRARVEKEQG